MDFQFAEVELEFLDTNRLQECERVIERGLKTFVDVGNALLEIRDSRLYRADYSTFEDYCRERWGFNRTYAFYMIESAKVITNLNVHNCEQVLPVNESQARPLVSLEPDLQIEAWQRAVETAPESGITAKHVQSIVDEIQNKPHVSFNSGNNEWYTPSEFVEAARRVMGEIELDPASSDIANQTVNANHYLTAEQDGLTFDWSGKVWMNPPYASELIGRFTEKLTEHFVNGDIDEAIVLVNNATETGWFQGMLEHASAVCFLRRRVKFLDVEGNASGAPLQGQAILYFGENVNLFVSEFGGFGSILYG